MSDTAHNPILTMALRWGAIFSAALAVVAGGVGMLVAGLPGLFGGLLGAVLSFVFLGLTELSMLIGRRVTAGDPNSPVFYGIVLGSTFGKLLIFFVFMFWLRGQAWLDPWVFVIAVLIAVFGSLVLDALAFQRARTPIAVPLPDDENGSGSAS